MFHSSIIIVYMYDIVLYSVVKLAMAPGSYYANKPVSI
jgi:hypothetical protein